MTKIASLLVLATAASMIGPVAAYTGDLLVGADLSSLPNVEQGGAVFVRNGEPMDPLPYLRQRGLDAVRLRLWHTPGSGTCGLQATLEMSERIRDAGFDLLLDIHYSDDWADPGHQTPPAAWAALSPAALRDSVRVYTRDVLAALAARGCTPSIVQLGNEITPGLLWNEGRVGGAFDTPAQWANLADLLGSASAGIDEALPAEERPEVMIHIDRGGDNAGARWFLDRLLAQDFDFDLIGLSFYPWWHGTLEDLDFNLDDLATRYGKDLIVVETAYPWTLDWFDETHNPVGMPGQLLPGLDATPAGQLSYLTELLQIVREVPDGHGRGVFWWEPGWIVAPEYGSSWENLTWFDGHGEVLPVLGALAPPADVRSPTPRTGFRIAPNPFQRETTMQMAASLASAARIEIFDIRGRRLANDTIEAGETHWSWHPKHAAAGTYLFLLHNAEQTWGGCVTALP